MRFFHIRLARDSANKMCHFKVLHQNLMYWKIIKYGSLLFPKNDDDDDHVDGVRLRLGTAATNGPTVHPQNYI